MHDRGDLDDRQVDRADAIAVADGLTADVEPGVHHHQPVLGRLLVPGDTQAGVCAEAAEMGQNLRAQALEDVPEIWAKPADVSEASAMRSGSVDLMTTSNAAIEMLPSSARRCVSIRRSGARSSATVCSICAWRRRSIPRSCSRGGSSSSNSPT
jgi:hypothetical protein